MTNKSAKLKKIALILAIEDTTDTYTVQSMVATHSTMNKELTKDKGDTSANAYFHT